MKYISLTVLFTLLLFSCAAPRPTKIKPSEFVIRIEAPEGMHVTFYIPKTIEIRGDYDN